LQKSKRRSAAMSADAQPAHGGHRPTLQPRFDLFMASCSDFAHSGFQLRPKFRARQDLSRRFIQRCCK